MTPQDFYTHLFFEVFPHLPNDGYNAIMTGVTGTGEEPVGEWYPWRGAKLRTRMENGFIIVEMDLGERVLAVRRTQLDTFKWVGRPPRQADLVKLMLVL